MTAEWHEYSKLQEVFPGMSFMHGKESRKQRKQSRDERS